MKVVVSSRGQHLTNALYYGGCKTKQQRYWWLRTAGRFVKLTNLYMPGNKAFCELMDLDAGEYKLGCGPVKGGVRIKFEVEDSEERSVE